MILADFLPARADASWQLAAQSGVRHAVVKCAPELTGRAAPDDFESLRAMVGEFACAGFRVCALEGDQFDMTRIKWGLSGRDEDIERYRAMLRNMGRLGIRLLCYNFMPRPGSAGSDWHRNAEVVLRGGARGAGFDASLMTEKALALSAGQLWDNLEYFLTAVLPVAEESGVVMALHPDDPPLPRLGEVARILGSEFAFERVWRIRPSVANAVTFCQANFRLMGGDVRAAASVFAGQGRLAYIHFRDVAGDASCFHETFHDDGPSDMAGLLAHYHRLGFAGPVRIDHVPALAGESPGQPGYGMLGRLHAVGYLQGLCDALGIPWN